MEPCRIARNFKKIVLLLKSYKFQYTQLQNNKGLHISSNIQSASKSTGYKKLAFEVNTNVRKDVLLFKHERKQFMIFLSTAGVFFSVGSATAFLFLLTSAKDPEPNIKDQETWWKNNVFWRNKNRFILLALTALFGTMLGFAMYSYPAHTVRQLWLLKGGEMVRIHTYGPFAANKEITIPLENTCCMGRSKNKDETDLYIKIKGDKLNYLVDTKGRFPYKSLFEQTVGLKRLHYKN